MLKVRQDKKPSETSEKTVDSVGVKEDMERGVMFRLQEQVSKTRQKQAYDAISFQPMDNQYICPVSYFQFLFAKFQCSAGQYRSTSPLHTAPQKICCSHTQKKKKKKWIEKQVKPQPSPSALSLKQKWETPHAWRWQCFQNFY